MTQLQAWKSLANHTKNWRTLTIALRHIERLEKKSASH